MTVHDTGRRQCGIVTFTKKGHAPSALQAALQTALPGRPINISVSNGSSTLLDMSARGLVRVARASVHYYNTEDEIDRVVAAVDSI